MSTQETLVRCVSTKSCLDIVVGTEYHVVGVIEARSGHIAYQLAEFPSDCSFHAYHFEEVENE
jgi:hypothetical protein